MSYGRQFVRIIKRVNSSTSNLDANVANGISSDTLQARAMVFHKQYDPVRVERKALKNTLSKSYLYENDKYQMLRSFLDDTKLSGDVHPGGLPACQEMSSEEFSIFFNRLLPTSGSSFSLKEAIPENMVVPLANKLYQFYMAILEREKKTRFTPMELHDLNKFSNWFLNENKLKLARKVLQQILRQTGSEQLPRDHQTLVTYFQLYLGSLASLWPTPKVQSACYDKLVRGSRRPKYVVYNSLPEGIMYDVLQKLLENDDWKHLRSSELDAKILYSLCHYNRMDLFEGFMERAWGIVDHPKKVEKEVPVDISSGTYPGSEVLIAIVTSFSYRNDLEKAVRLVDAFLNKYPQMDLRTEFWEKLFLWTRVMFDRKLDPLGSLQKACWLRMLSWYKSRGESVPYSSYLASCRYEILKQTSNYKDAMAMFPDYMSAVYAKSAAAKHNLTVVRKYQKFVIRELSARGKRDACTQFIEQWRFNEENEKELQDTFQRHWNKYTIRQEKRRSSARNKQLKLQDDDDDDFSLTGVQLW
ncbi:Aep2p Ecym_4618 [Eremothecium cymbalariae DBVPG|uniref:ATPase expression protein 2, mitochondrial n=1 Tax=Eremothecium cymbalariae (strain CBS 270.75 / DBVPG 7215 / KCTC 17166 / NRRL Y-17582) TaxID=931890 RepID=G8JSC5_ERECY|nr:hypothetical protein Ecym_4618 [Eremothecium cymbalariae DBVPG\